MSCNFRIGQKVVCIDASKTPGASDDWLGDRPKEGAVYTIRGMRPARNGDNVIVLYFDEIRRMYWAGQELGYYHLRFRALQEGGDKLAALREILANPSKPVSGEEGPKRKRQRAKERA